MLGEALAICRLNVPSLELRAWILSIVRARDSMINPPY